MPDDKFMGRSSNYILPALFLSVCISVGCNLSAGSAPDSLPAKPTATPDNTAKAKTDAAVNANAGENAAENEIKSCSPTKVNRGDTISITFNQPHGGYLAIRRKVDGKWFFLYDVEKSEPVWNIREMKSLNEISINTETAVKLNQFRRRRAL